ncbi:VOC family protein [Chitinivorax sp. B]|uniref:VOC family protein n=1 Tax=Chitinivorax sp. B TaxID=2502235 RepID=UPI0010F9FD7B|nr:VOC family protein [Chitinivorax sp. B]
MDSLQVPKKGPFKVLGIGEVVLRVADMDTMLKFYTETIGLQLLRRFDDEVAFMKIADGVAGQVQTLTLFNRRKHSNFDDKPWPGWDAKQSTLHHIALTITVSDYEAMKAFVEQKQIPHNIAVHTWIGWRSIFLIDPEGNTVELVCYDERIDRHETYHYDKLYGDPHGEH